MEPSPTPKRRANLIWIFLGLLVLAVAAGSVAGYFTGTKRFSESQAARLSAWNLEQIQLAATDIAEKKYGVALQRLDEVQKNDPEYPGAETLRQQALAAMNATPTPRPTHTPVPSPTPDAPRAEQLLAKARQEFVDKKYAEMIGTLLTLKVEVPGFEPERVDGLLWVALRYRGVQLLKESNRLTEGIYYLDLAANYAPLDKEAESQVQAAMVFLRVYQSAYYYRNKDIEKSWKAFEEAYRIRPSYNESLRRDYADILVQNGDALVHQNACAAWWFYEEALRLVPDYEAALQGRDYAIVNCGEAEPIPPDGYGPAPEETSAE